ncbi:MAG: hypothetical protein WC835_01365 [Candidatus Paceibacterota bacterium]
MPLKKRRLYFLFFSVVFIIAIPALLLYTSGYRLNNSFRLVKTGGIFVSVPISGAEIYVNNKLYKTTNIIQRDLFEQNLTPDTYFIFVYKEGYLPWSKELKVQEQIVVDAHAFLVPREPKLEEIIKTIPDKEVDDKVLPNPYYNEVLALFSARKIGGEREGLYSESASATTTITRNKVMLIREGNAISAKWLGNEEDAPYSFCDGYKKECLEKIPVFSSPTKIKTFDFYPGRNDVIIIARKNRIDAVETDKRRIQNFALIYAGGDPDFRIGSDGNLYIKENSTVYKVTL